MRKTLNAMEEWKGKSRVGKIIAAHSTEQQIAAMKHQDSPYSSDKKRLNYHSVALKFSSMTAVKNPTRLTIAQMQAPESSPH